MSIQPQKDKKKLDSSQAVVRFARCGKRLEIIAKRDAINRLREAQKKAKKDGKEAQVCFFESASVSLSYMGMWCECQ